MDRFEVAEQLRRVIAWELDAQTGMGRSLDAIPLLLADSLLDYFEVSVRPGVSLAE